MDLSRFAQIVRPARIMTFSEVLQALPTEDAVLLWGDDEKEFAKAIGRVGWGSAALLLGSASTDVETKATQESFHDWYRGDQVEWLPLEARTWVKHTAHEDGPYGSHQDVLKRVVEATSGSVLELGSGDGSTPLLHDIASSKGRLVVTVDSDSNWLDRFVDLASPFHAMVYAKDPAESDQIVSQRWSVVFVDHAPGESRKRAIERAREVSDFVLVHDTEELSYGVEGILSSFKHRRDYRKHRPWTTVVSDRRSDV